MSVKTFQVKVDTINGVIQEFPPVMTFYCNKVSPLGVNIVRDFDEDACGIAKRVFLFLYDGQTFGTTQWKSLTDYTQFISTACACCPQVCDVLLNGCRVMINNCFVSMSR